MKNIIKIILILTILVSIYINRPLVMVKVVSGMELWSKCVFPSVFPILIISDFIMSTNLIKIVSDLLGFTFAKFFKVSKYASYVFIMSVFSGCPANAKYIKDLYDNKVIGKNECVKILSMSLLYNPLLILSITPFLSTFDSYFLIVTNIIINLVIGLINRNYKIDNITSDMKVKSFDLVNSISNSINVLLLILGSIIVFITISAIIPIDSPLIKGILEIANGIKLVGNSNYLYKYKLLFTGILMGFSGFSIIIQIKSIFKDTNLDYSLFYKSRIMHIGLFMVIIYLRTLIN